MKNMIKAAVLTGAVVLSLGVMASAEGEVKVGAMSGPTAMGMMKLMDDAENGATANAYEFAELSTDPAAFVAPLAKGEIDIAAVPANLASVIYNNTEGGVKVLAVNVLGVLDIVERGESVQSVEDLKGKTIYATGQGATPEYTFSYILAENGIDIENDLTVQWCADTTEALSYITADEEAIAMLPQPFVTVAGTKVEGLHIALNLSDEWAALDTGCEITTGVVVARTAFVEEQPEKVETFMEELKASVAYVSEDLEGEAALVEKYGILPAAAIAQKAVPNCSITCLTGEEMKTAVSGYLDILFGANPKAVGGAVPADDFYYGCE